MRKCRVESKLRSDSGIRTASRLLSAPWRLRSPDSKAANSFSTESPLYAAQRGCSLPPDSGTAASALPTANSRRRNTGAVMKGMSQARARWIPPPRYLKPVIRPEGPRLDTDQGRPQADQQFCPQSRHCGRIPARHRIQYLSGRRPWSLRRALSAPMRRPVPPARIITPIPKVVTSHGPGILSESRVTAAGHTRGNRGIYVR